MTEEPFEPGPVFAFGPGGYQDEGCIVSPSCLKCPLAVCVEDMGSFGPVAIYKAIRATERAGAPLAPHLLTIKAKVRWAEPEEIVALSYQGLSQPAIASRLGISASRVGQIVREHKRNKQEVAP